MAVSIDFGEPWLCCGPGGPDSDFGALMISDLISVQCTGLKYTNYYQFPHEGSAPIWRRESGCPHRGQGEWDPETVQGSL